MNGAKLEPPRHLGIGGTYNFRDIGGYVATKGTLVSWGKLFRSDSLHNLSISGSRDLLQLGIRNVVDLRFNHEIQRWPNPFENSGEIQYWHVPLAPDLIAHQNFNTIEEFYIQVVETCGARLVEILEFLAESSTLPVVVHCTGGKDRTGIIMALLLELLGVSRNNVIYDYVLTGRYFSKLLPKLLENAKRVGRDMKYFVRLLDCREEVISNTLRHIDQKYGGVREYLFINGLNQRTVKLLRWNLTESAKNAGIVIEKHLLN